eukprot:15333369-Ditylum_brightwellii.AAC.1
MHIWNGSKKCHWYDVFNEYKAPKQGEELIATVKQHLEAIGKPIVNPLDDSHPPIPPPLLP